MTTSDEFYALIEKPEGAHVEFKSASGGFHLDDHQEVSSMAQPTPSADVDP
jgi:hypothetical protein